MYFDANVCMNIFLFSERGRGEGGRETPNVAQAHRYGHTQTQTDRQTDTHTFIYTIARGCVCAREHACVRIIFIYRSIPNPDEVPLLHMPSQQNARAKHSTTTPPTPTPP